MELELGRPAELSRWEESLSPRWKAQIQKLIQSTRDTGGALLPVLLPFRESLEKQRQVTERIRTRTSGVWMQVSVLGALLPVLIGVLTIFVPEVFSHWMGFVGICWGAVLLNLGAVFWVIALSQEALRGGVCRSQQGWALEGALVLAQIRSRIIGGRPPDLAWSESVGGIENGSFIEFWGMDLWTQTLDRTQKEGRLLSEWEGLRTGLVVHLRDAIVRGGRSLDIVERTEQRWFEVWESQVERLIETLPTKLLWPFFLCILPALFGLLGFSIWCAAFSGAA